MIKTRYASPLISCLCVSNDRPHLLSKAINNFLAQSYSNKELVIVSSHFNEVYDDIIKQFVGVPIKYIFYCRQESGSRKKVSLGELRNYAVENCSGEYFCTWDDDDWNHVQRLTIQMESILGSNKMACISLYLLIYDQTQNEVYLSFTRPWEQTLMCNRKVVKDLNISFPAMEKSEDFHFVKSLIQHNLVFPIIAPNIYIYVYHGSNTWDQTFFHDLLSKTFNLPQTLANQVNRIISHETTFEEATSILESPNILQNLNYFHGWKLD